uniref:Putative ixodes 26 kDa salivary protein n=1 Tax=Ixodes ricinus TaxID=34613 RepID=A0A0K8RMR9_IXORI
MTVLTRALTFALFIVCFAAEPRSLSAIRRRGSGENTVTIAYLLDGNGFESKDASPNSEVNKWLRGVHQQAELALKNVTQVEIKFKISDLNLTDTELSEKLLSWTSKGSCGSDSLMHAGTVLGEIKLESMNWPVQPHIICVLTKQKLYQGDFINLLGYALHQTLCYTSVPMILTYQSSSDVIYTGNLLSELVLNSTRNDASTSWKEYFNECNRQQLFTYKYYKQNLRSFKSRRMVKKSTSKMQGQHKDY